MTPEAITDTGKEGAMNENQLEALIELLWELVKQTRTENGSKAAHLRAIRKCRKLGLTPPQILSVVSGPFFYGESETREALKMPQEAQP